MSYQSQSQSLPRIFNIPKNQGIIKIRYFSFERNEHIEELEILLTPIASKPIKTVQIIFYLSRNSTFEYSNGRVKKMIGTFSSKQKKFPFPFQKVCRSINTIPTSNNNNRIETKNSDKIVIQLSTSLHFRHRSRPLPPDGRWSETTASFIWPMAPPGRWSDAGLRNNVDRENCLATSCALPKGSFYKS